MAAPLADRMRPETLEDIVGQKHLLAPGKALRNIIESGRIPNLIFYGPSGVGKTTLASIIARRTDMRLHKLNGTTASTADIKAVVEELDTLAGRAACCCIWMRSSISIKNNSRRCWSTSRMGGLP